MKKCPYCGTQLNDDVLFCTECGKQIPQGNVCSHCGALVNDGDVFCQNCGKKIDEAPSSAPTESIRKTCPHCRAVVDDGDVFCQNCGKKINEAPFSAPTELIRKTCPHCRAVVDDGDVFCQNCGKKIDEVPSSVPTEPTRKTCPDCGTVVNDDDVFCENCGKNINDENCEFNSNEVSQETYNDIENSEDNKKAIILIVIGLAFLVLFVGGWYGYKEYSVYNERKLAREKFVADSLEMVRQDSIKLAEQKEQERIEANKIAELHEKMSFENFLGMLKNYDQESYAQKCGLSLIYRDFVDGGEDGVDCLEIVYGYEVEKGRKKEDFDGESNSYVINPKSNHSCYFLCNYDSSSSASLHFQDKEDAEIFFSKAQKYGLIKMEDMEEYYIPNKRLPKEQTIADNSSYDNYIGIISPPLSRGDWYNIYIGLDF